MSTRIAIRTTGRLAAVLLTLGVAAAARDARAYPAWDFVDAIDADPTTGINYNTAYSAVTPAFAVLGDTLYVAWTEGSATDIYAPRQLRVRSYNGSSWAMVDGGGVSGLNRDPTVSAKHPALAVLDGSLYLAWVEQLYVCGTGCTSSYDQLYVKRFNPTTSTWTEVGMTPGTPPRGINGYVNGGVAVRPSLAVHNGALYAAWSERVNSVDHVMVRRYDNAPGSWTFVDEPSNDPFLGLHRNPARHATDPRLVLWGSSLYIIFLEDHPTTNFDQVHVYRYDGGTTWTAVDGNTDVGLNLNPNQGFGGYPKIGAADSLYVTWQERDTSSMEVIRLRRYGGGSTWTWVDGGAALHAGLSRDTVNDYAFFPVPFGYNNAVYLTWLEERDGGNGDYTYQVRVARPDGVATREMIDGNLTAGLNSNPAVNAGKNLDEWGLSAMVVYKGRLYVAWHESNGTSQQLRVKRTNLPPTVATSAATAVSGSTATLNGECLFDGGQSITLRGFKYKRTSDPDSSYVDLPETLAGGFTVGSFGRSITGLQPSTSYSFKAYAGTATPNYLHVGDVLTFTTSSISASIAASLSEDTLAGSAIIVTLNGTTFLDSTLAPSSFTLDGAPAGLSIASVSYGSTTQCTLTLAYSGPDFDTDVANLRVTVAGAELTGGGTLTSTNGVTVSANGDAESISIADAGDIREREESGKTITVTLTGGTFAATIDGARWSVANLPAGVSKGSVTRDGSSNTRVFITLSGNATANYDTNITNVTVTCDATQYADAAGGGSLTDSSGVTLFAKTKATVATGASSAIGTDRATVAGEVTADGGAAVTARGIEYKKSTDSSYVAVAAASAGLGTYSVTLAGLASNTGYNARAYATNEEGTVYGSVTSFTTASIAATIAADPALGEASLGNASLTVSLSGTSFATASLLPTDFTLTQAPLGLTIASAEYQSSTACLLDLAFDGTDFDSDITALGITIAGAALTSGAPLMAANTLAITANDDAESLAIHNDAVILEGAEDGGEITVTLTGGTFAASLTPGNWSVAGLPSGVGMGSVSRSDATTVVITLSGDSIADYDADITGVTVTCTASEYHDATGGGLLTAASGVTLTARTAPTVQTDAATEIGALAATLNGAVTADGKASILARGFEYKESGAATYSALTAGAGSGAFSARLTGLAPLTTYDIRAFATNAEGTAYGDVLSFSTGPRRATVAASLPLTEESLSGATLVVTLDGDTFVDDVLDAAAFTLVNAPVGVSVAAVTYLSATECRLTLAFDGTDFDTDVVGFGVTIGAAELAGASALAATSLAITARVESATCYVDADGDGYGAAATLTSSDEDCTDAGEAAVGGDCDDTDAARHPSAAESCDGVDADCDGSLVDEDSDSDADGLPDCIDACPNDAAKSAPGVCGCGVAEALAATDADSDGLVDCLDTCPHDGANDGDGDGVCGDSDNCPEVSNADQADSNGDGVGDACSKVEPEPEPEPEPTPSGGEGCGGCTGGGAPSVVLLLTVLLGLLAARRQASRHSGRGLVAGG